jgi:predicted PhzF superfamily epimerase YddE/YHI9
MLLHVVRVFVGPGETGGNPLGVFLDVDLPGERRQEIAADLGYSETVFVTDSGSGTLRIHTPVAELPLAGHPLVGTSWLLWSLDKEVDALLPPAGIVPTWTADGLTWIRADPAKAPEIELRQLAAPSDVDSHPVADGFVDVWAWEDEAAGRVRSRVFAGKFGIPEDEATGAAALRLTAFLGRPLTIRQGVGSEIITRPGPDGLVEVGGRVSPIETRPYP